MDQLSIIFIILALFVGVVLGYLLSFFIQSRKKQDIFELPEVKRLSESVQTGKDENTSLQARIVELSRELSGLEQRNKDLELHLNERGKELEQSKLELKKEFENLAHRIFEEKSHSFRKTSMDSLKSLLDPFDKNIKEFKTTVNETYIKGTQETSELKQELKQLRELNQTMSTETRELTQALKGENKTQGNWGEMILERILENSGLTKGREYELQYSSSLEDGTRVQPDVIIQLPEEKHIIIDSKVSLKAYEMYFNAGDEEHKKRYRKEHIESLKNHIKNLASKSYTNAKGLNTPDFVLLFIPIEASFGMALDEDADLYDFAWQRQIVMVTPSTLLATLRTISSIWKHEYTNRNAAEIAQAAGRLYDKFVGVIKKFQQAGRQLETAQRSFDDAMSSFGDGRGNLISRVDKLRAMGVNPSKSLKSELDTDRYLTAMENDGIEDETEEGEDE